MRKLLNMFFIEMMRICLSFGVILGALLLFIKTRPEEGRFSWNLAVLAIVIMLFGLIKLYRGYYREKQILDGFFRRFIKKPADKIKLIKTKSNLKKIA